MVPAEPTDARTFIMFKEIEEEAFLYDFGLPSIDNTKQKHQKEESKHANTPLKATAAIQKPSRDQLRGSWPVGTENNSCPAGAVEAGRGLPL